MTEAVSIHTHVTPERFTEIRREHRPAVLKGLVADWPATAIGRESDDALMAYLLHHDSGQPVGTYVGAAAIGGRFFYGADTLDYNFRHGPAPLAQALDRLRAALSDPHPPAIAVQSVPIQSHMPGFAEENRLALLPHVAPRIWIGNASVTRTHYDLNDNIACLVAGQRRFFLFPPAQLPNLYPGPFDRTIGGVPVSMVDPDAPDLRRYPRFEEAQAHMLTVVAEPGDALYIPYGWWHHVRSLEPFNVMVNYWWNEAAPQPATPYEALYHAILALRDLPPEQRDIWRGLYDYYVFGRHGDPVGHLAPVDKGTLGPLTPSLTRRLKDAIIKALS